MSRPFEPNGSRTRPRLGLYLIPGFPDWPSSVEALDAAVSIGVDFIEYPVISEKRFSTSTGSLIAGILHRSDAYEAGSRPALRAWLDRISTGVGVVYRGAWPDARRWSADRCLAERASAFVFEYDPVDREAYRSACRERGASLIQTIRCVARSTDAPVPEPESAFTYMSLGDRTGSRAADAHQISERCARWRLAGAVSPIYGAFGLKTAEDVRDVVAAGCDGVIVGSAALEQLSAGVAPFRSWLKTLVDVIDER